MAKAIALARTIELQRIDAAIRESLRIVLVSGCAIALIFAGKALPF
jgi:hypothetical protein